MSVERRKLIEDLKQFSVHTGEKFTLASGQKSNVYVDVKPTMLFGPSMHNLAKLLYSFAEMFGRYDMVAGVPLGGSHLAAMVAMFGAPTSVVLIRKEIKNHGTQKLVEMPGDFAGRKVILFEDVITTGQSAINAAKILEEYGLDIRGIVAVVDRRADTTPPTLGDYGFRALVDFEELVEEVDAQDQQVSTQEA
jgi:orotate phosphoribosyltransferase